EILDAAAAVALTVAVPLGVALPLARLVLAHAEGRQARWPVAREVGIAAEVDRLRGVVAVGVVGAATAVAAVAGVVVGVGAEPARRHVGRLDDDVGARERQALAALDRRRLARRRIEE